MYYYNEINRKQEEKVLWLQVLEKAIKASKAEKKASAAIANGSSDNNTSQDTIEEIESEEDDLWFQPLWRNDSSISCCEVCNSNFWLLASKIHCRGW